MDSPFFSIIVPTFNSSRFIERLLNSVYNQKMSNEDFELILVDDGSDQTDKERLVKILCRFSPPPIVLNNDGNFGPLFSRLRGQKAAHGQYLLFLDSDDCLVLDSLHSLKSHLERNPADICFFNALLSTGSIYKPFEETPILPSTVFGKLLIDGLNAPLWTKCVNSKLLASFDYSVTSEYAMVRFGDDMMHSALFYMAATSFTYFGSTVYQHLNNRTSLSNSYYVTLEQLNLSMSLAYWVFLASERYLSPPQYDSATLFRLTHIIDFLVRHVFRRKTEFEAMVTSTLGHPFFVYLFNKTGTKLAPKTAIKLKILKIKPNWLSFILLRCLAKKV